MPGDRLRAALPGARRAQRARRRSAARIDDARGSREHRARFVAYLHHVQDQDLTLGIAMTDAKGDRCKRPHEQANPDSYVHVVERNAQGHRDLGHQGDRHRRALHARVPGHAVPQHGRGRRRLRRLLRGAGRRRRRHHRRAAGRAARAKSSSTARRCSRASTASRPASCIFDHVFVPWERVFFAGEWEHSATLTYSYATHHRHTCIARARRLRRPADRRRRADVRGQRLRPRRGDAPARADGRADHDRRGLLRLRRRGQRLRQAPTRTAAPSCPTRCSPTSASCCWPPRSTTCTASPTTSRGGLIVTLPGPDEDHNPATAATLADVLRANPDVPYDKRIEVARFIEDLTAVLPGRLVLA